MTIAANLGQISVESSMLGMRGSLVPDIPRKLSTQGIDGVASHTPISFTFLEENPKFGVSHIYSQRTSENTKEPKVFSSQSQVLNKSAEIASAGKCSLIRTDDGVAEFRGPSVHGLVRFAQVNEHELQIEATFDGLTPGPHSWSVNEYGDVREGAASTGLPYSPSSIHSLAPAVEEEAAGMLGTLMADSSGHAEYNSRSDQLAVWDIIGRSVVLYQSCQREIQNAADAIGCAVIARSSVPGTGGARQLCNCDGTLIWQSRS